MCGYTGHFFIYHGKWPFYRGKLPRCVWLDFPEINLPWEISMVTSKIAKKPLITLNLVKRKGFSIPKAKQPIRFLQHETPQNCFFKTGFFRTVERKIDGDMADFTLRWTKQGNVEANFELVCWDRSNCWMQLNCKIELYTFAKSSWITYQLKIIGKFST